MEIKALEELQVRMGRESIADVCRELGVDPYDFKDRWGSLLRHNDPGELLEKIANVRKHMHEASVADMANEMGYTHSTIRSIITKLKVRPEDVHQRTKVNLAHRMVPNCGTLKEAKKQLSGRPKSSKKHKRKRYSDDSDSSDDSDTSDEEYGIKKAPRTRATRATRSQGEVKVEKVSGVQSEESAPRTVKRELTIPELTLEMLDDPDIRLIEDFQDYLPPKLQLRVLYDLSDTMDLKQACERREVDFNIMARLWQSILDYCSKTQLEALIYTILVLRRLGYGISVLSNYLGQPEPLLRSCIRNLWMDLGPRHGFSFDVTTYMVRQEPLTISRMAELCNVPMNVARLLIKRAGQGKDLLSPMQDALDEKRASERVVWLFERGLSMPVVCAVLKLKERVVAQAWPNE